MRKIARRLHFPEAAAEDKKENKTEKTAVSHEGFLNQTLETSPFWFSEEQRNLKLCRAERNETPRNREMEALRSRVKNQSLT